MAADAINLCPSHTLICVHPWRFHGLRPEISGIELIILAE